MGLFKHHATKCCASLRTITLLYAVYIGGIYYCLCASFFVQDSFAQKSTTFGCLYAVLSTFFLGGGAEREGISRRGMAKRCTKCVKRRVHVALLALALLVLINAPNCVETARHQEVKYP